MNKKLIPLDILIPVEKVLAENTDIVENKREENCFYSIHDRDESAGYYYKIIADPKKVVSSSSSNYGSDMVYCKRFPASSKDIRENTFFLKREDLLANLSNWIEAIKTFNDIQSVYDDPFVKKYQEYYFNEFRIVDEDADTSPFDPMQQDALEQYLLYAEQRLLESRDAGMIDQDTANEIIADTQEAIEQLPISTKNKAFTRLTTIWAKVYKSNKKLAKDLLSKAKEELIKELVKEGVKYLPTLIKTLKDTDAAAELLK